MRRSKFLRSTNANGSSALPLPLAHYSPTVVIDHIFPQLFTKLAQNNILIEEFTLVAMFKVLGDTLPHISRQFPIRHVLLNLLHLR
jgi:hypothetical protein